MFHNAAIQGRMTPRFLGGSLSSQTYMRPQGTREGRFKIANHSEMSQIDECSRGRPERKVMFHPPL